MCPGGNQINKPINLARKCKWDPPILINWGVPTLSSRTNFPRRNKQTYFRYLNLARVIFSGLYPIYDGRRNK